MTDDIRFAHNAIAMNISRDMAILHGLVKPTAEEVTTYNAEARERWERDLAAWARADEFRSALDAVTDPVARAVLDMHRPVDDDTAECYHCTSGEYGDHDPWPCDTTEAVAQALGVDAPEGYLGHRPGPEPSTMPPDGYKPYTLHRLSGFVDDAMAHTIDGTAFHA